VVDKKEVAAFKMHKATVSSLAFSPDGKWLVSGSYDGTMLFWEVNIPVKGEAVESTGKLREPGEK